MATFRWMWADALWGWKGAQENPLRWSKWYPLGDSAVESLEPTASRGLRRFIPKARAQREPSDTPPRSSRAWVPRWRRRERAQITAAYSAAFSRRGRRFSKRSVALELLLPGAPSTLSLQVPGGLVEQALGKWASLVADLESFSGVVSRFDAPGPVEIHVTVATWLGGAAGARLLTAAIAASTQAVKSLDVQFELSCAEVPMAEIVSLVSAATSSQTLSLDQLCLSLRKTLEDGADALASIPKMSQEDAEALAGALSPNDTLHQLSLNLGLVQGPCTHTLSHFGAALRRLSGLRVVLLSGTRLPSGGALPLAELLDSNGALEELDLSGLGIQDLGAEHLASALRSHACLTSLDLAGNSIGEPGIVRLADALKTNTTLQHLSLAFNQFTDQAGDQIASMLSTNSTLTSLNLSVGCFLDGPVGPAGHGGPIGPAVLLALFGALGPFGPAGHGAPIGPAGPFGPFGPMGPAGPREYMSQECLESLVESCGGSVTHLQISWKRVWPVDALVAILDAKEVSSAAPLELGLAGSWPQMTRELRDASERLWKRSAPAIVLAIRASRSSVDQRIVCANAISGASVANLKVSEYPSLRALREVLVAQLQIEHFRLRLVLPDGTLLPEPDNDDDPCLQTIFPCLVETLEQVASRWKRESASHWQRDRSMDVDFDAGPRSPLWDD